MDCNKANKKTMRRFNFDRYKSNTLLAEGVGVHAENIVEATKRAIEYNGNTSELIAFRDNMPCPIEYCKICDDNRLSI